MSHQINDKIQQFLAALQTTGHVQQVGLVKDTAYIVEYQIVFNGQLFNLWHNKLAANELDRYGWEKSNPFQRFTTHFTNGFDHDSV